MGDGVLIYFGYPQAHEDDAERAVMAGLELVGAVALSQAKLSGMGRWRKSAPNFGSRHWHDCRRIRHKM
jgi:hypothetical protein